MERSRDHRPRLTSVMIDCRDMEAMSRFWSELLGVGIRLEVPGFRWLEAQREGGWSLAFQEVADPTPGKNRIHVDGHYSGDLDELTARIESLGGRLVDRQVIPGFVWNVYADPEDNVFCFGHEA